MKPHQNRTLVPLLLLLVSYFFSCSQGMEAELKCSACEAVAAELQRRLEAELPRTHVDLRHRLDKDGQRYGKIIDWKVSEMRAVELLEDLCDSMDSYTLSTPSTSNSDTDSSSSNSTEQSSQQQAQPQPQPAWVKYKGEGSVHVARDSRPADAEEQLRKKQLTTFCGMLLEAHEEEVVEALTTDQFAAGVTPVLCQQITSRCKGKQYVSASSSDEQKEQGGSQGPEAADREL